MNPCDQMSDYITIALFEFAIVFKTIDFYFLITVPTPFFFFKYLSVSPVLIINPTQTLPRAMFLLSHKIL